MSLFQDLVQRGLRSAQPVATAVAEGTLYYVTDEEVTERSNGTAWESYSDGGAVNTSGTPATGNLAKFTDADTITNADLTGDVTTAGGVATTIPNNTVSYAKMQDVSAVSKLLGRGSAAGAGDPQEITLGTGLAMAGTTLNASAGAGTVDTSGTPAAGNLAKFTDADTISNADLTGDVTTAGGVAATIPNDTVSYAKMQNVSAASKLLGRGDSGAGDPQEITLGTGLAMAGTTLSASGGGGGGTGGGSLILLEQHTASASTSLDFTTGISATYDEYVIELINIIPATDNVDLLFRVSTDGGSTYDSGANYGRATRLDTATFNTVLGAVSGLTSITLIANVDNTTTQASVNASMRFFNPGSASLYKGITFQGFYKNNDTNYYSFVGEGHYLSATAVNAFRFAFSSGNIASGIIRLYGIAKTASAGGKIAQVVNVQTGTLATGTTTIPFDNTIPQNTEGDQYMTLAVTPTSATNKLKIEVVIQLSNSVANWYTAALFQDTTAGALAAASVYQGTAGGGVHVTFTHYMTAGTTSATTFKVRAGGTFAGTTSFNGNAGAGLMGGVMASSITITEIVP